MCKQSFCVQGVLWLLGRDTGGKHLIEHHSLRSVKTRTARQHKASLPSQRSQVSQAAAPQQALPWVILSIHFRGTPTTTRRMVCVFPEHTAFCHYPICEIQEAQEKAVNSENLSLCPWSQPGLPSASCLSERNLTGSGMLGKCCTPAGSRG